MDFFINEILENDKVKDLLLTETQYVDDAKAFAEKIKNGADIMPEDGIPTIFACAFLADYALEINTKKGISKELLGRAFEEAGE